MAGVNIEPIMMGNQLLQSLEELLSGIESTINSLQLRQTKELMDILLNYRKTSNSFLF